MATRTLTAFVEDVVHHRNARTSSLPPLVRRRKLTALVLIAATIVLGVLLVLAFGPTALLFYLPALPMGFILLWVSTDALRFDERELEEGTPS